MCVVSCWFPQIRSHPCPARSVSHKTDECVNSPNGLPGALVSGWGQREPQQGFTGKEGREWGHYNSGSVPEGLPRTGCVTSMWPWLPSSDSVSPCLLTAPSPCFFRPGVVTPVVIWNPALSLVMSLHPIYFRKYRLSLFCF